MKKDVSYCGRGVISRYPPQASDSGVAFRPCRTCYSVVRNTDFDGWIFPLKNHCQFHNGVTDVAGLSSALYRGPHIIDLDKLKKHLEPEKTHDIEEPSDPVEQVTNFSGFPFGDLEVVRGHRKNKAG